MQSSDPTSGYIAKRNLELRENKRRKINVNWSLFHLQLTHNQCQKLRKLNDIFIFKTMYWNKEIISTCIQSEKWSHFLAIQSIWGPSCLKNPKIFSSYSREHVFSCLTFLSASIILFFPPYLCLKHRKKNPHLLCGHIKTIAITGKYQIIDNSIPQISHRFSECCHRTIFTATVTNSITATSSNIQSIKKHIWSCCHF